ncbi:tRNA (adenosine(37)-N6)-threonylcarbamoyltransferase complex transferase subunit TsaD [Candidatus Riflebacteria bacterium]
MLILGIESSCDDSSCSLVKNGREVLACITQEQTHIHSKYGGVVPELASRAHLHYFGDTLSKTLQRAKKSMQEVDMIAVTQGPGLMGSLLTGVMFARGLALQFNLPVFPVHHILAHIYTVFLENNTPPQFPFITLMISGGHTYLLRCKSHNEFEVLGQTLDDSPGELFDKIARKLGLGFPGGPVVAKEAENGNPDIVPLPMPLKRRPGVDFSFSGLKTAVLREIKRGEFATEDILASMEQQIAKFLLNQLLKAIKTTEYNRVVIVGGVSANKRLRQFMRENIENRATLFFPDLKFATDNGAMVASRAFFLSQSITKVPSEFTVLPVLPIS